MQLLLPDGIDDEAGADMLRQAEDEGAEAVLRTAALAGTPTDTVATLTAS